MIQQVESYRIDPDEIRRGLELILDPGQVTELRVLGARIEGEYRAGTLSGFFDREHIDELIAACQRIRSAKGTYFVPNPLRPELLARCYNRARITKDSDPLTNDKDILERRWLLIDVDGCRPAGVSASDTEKAATEEVATAIDYWLWEKGFPPGLVGDSGNGTHLMIPMRLPADDGGKIKRLLATLAKEFNTAQAQVDTAVGNAARIWKLPGTLTAKGDHCPEIGREWRMSRIMQVCEGFTRN